MLTTKTNRRRKPRPACFETSRRLEVLPEPSTLARHLALLADLHLQQGLHGSAELLARQAETAREAGH